jgi:hypothetical protein
MFTDLVISLIVNLFEHFIDSQSHIDLTTALNISVNRSSRKFVIYFKGFNTDAASTGNAGGANDPAVRTFFRLLRDTPQVDLKILLPDNCGHGAAKAASSTLASTHH